MLNDLEAKDEAEELLIDSVSGIKVFLLVSGASVIGLRITWCAATLDRTKVRQLLSVVSTGSGLISRCGPIFPFGSQLGIVYVTCCQAMLVMLRLAEPWP